MPRANRTFCKGYVWHVTHRCHKRSFLLKFSRDRKRWRHWLFEARKRFGLSVLNYIATSNHIHLLIWDRGNSEISSSMQLVASRTAQEFNRRKKRQGAFWEDRYHATAVQSGDHLARCMTYIDLNMVRAGVVTSPSEWDVSGYSEIQKPWLRKALIDYPVLCDLLGEISTSDLAIRLRDAAKDSAQCSIRQKCWTQALGVGDEAFVDELKIALGPKGRHRRTIAVGESHCLREAYAPYLRFS